MDRAKAGSSGLLKRDRFVQNINEYFVQEGPPNHFRYMYLQNSTTP